MIFGDARVRVCVCKRMRFGRNIDEQSRNSTKCAMRWTTTQQQNWTQQQFCVFVYLLVVLIWLCAAWPKKQQQQQHQPSTQYMDEIEYRRQTKRACNFCATNNKKHEPTPLNANWLCCVRASSIRAKWNCERFVGGVGGRCFISWTHTIACRIYAIRLVSLCQMNIELHFCTGRIINSRITWLLHLFIFGSSATLFWFYLSFLLAVCVCVLFLITFFPSLSPFPCSFPLSLSLSRSLRIVCYLFVCHSIFCIRIVLKSLFICESDYSMHI